MKQFRKPMAVLGLLSGAMALVLVVMVGNTFGLPGSAEYDIYQNFNRSMAVLLALQAFSLLAFAMTVHESEDILESRLSTVSVVMWLAMAVGTAAEFWLYSDLPYPGGPADFNMRTAAFALFFFGSVVAGVILSILAIRLLRSQRIAWLPAILLSLHAPLFIAFFFTSPSIFVAPAVSSIVAAGPAIGWGRNGSKREYAPVLSKG